MLTFDPMQVFYCDTIRENHVTLPTDEVRHLHVLRYAVGDSIILMDGKGNKISGEILSLNKKKASVIIDSIEKQESPYRIFNLCIAPTKNFTRIEWCIEKAVELGVQNIYFFKSFHSVRKQVKLNRLRKKIKSACKQSLKWYLPTIHEMTSLKEIIQNPAFNDNLKLISHLGENSENAVSLIRNHGRQPLTVMVGPEGDFNTDELNLAINSGWKQVHLGNARLRTETAALYLTTLNYSSQYL